MYTVKYALFFDDDQRGLMRFLIYRTFVGKKKCNTLKFLRSLFGFCMAESKAMR